MDPSRIAALLAAVGDMAKLLDTIDIGDVFSGFTCTELDGIATVLAVAGHEDTAAFVIARHAEGDEYGESDVDDDNFDAHAAIARLLDLHGAGDHAEVVKASEDYVRSLLADEPSDSAILRDLGMDDEADALDEHLGDNF